MISKVTYVPSVSSDPIQHNSLFKTNEQDIVNNHLFHR